ncbi:MAG: uncharacterized protein A8A55_2558 [Amphiamblys sp. WSBS2006]|nr:MAG: uncharacterized protein A8A55_2558 [Amphiamblys sp. WSBS2006]
MQNISVVVAALAVCVGALSGNFTYIPRDVLLRFQTEQEKSIYVLEESKQADKLCSVYFRYDATNKRVPSPVSLLRFVYDETEAKERYPQTRDIAEEVARFIADHAEVDTERRLFFVSFADEASPVQAVPKGIAEVSVVRSEESNIDYLYKKEKEHGSIFDRFLAVEECKREDKKKTPRIKNLPAKRKEAALLLSFLAAKGFQLELKAPLSMHWEEGNNLGLKFPYGVSLFVSEESSWCLDLFDLTETMIKKLAVSSFDIAKMKLKNTHIEELFLVDEAAVEFFYDSMERSEFYVEKVSFGNRLNPKSEKFLKLIKLVHEGETTAPRKIKTLVFGKGSFFGFLQKTRRITKRKIHVEELAVTQGGKDIGPETETRIVVSKKIGITGNARVLLFIELGPELSHFNIDEVQTQCLSPEIPISRINIQLTKNKIIVRENLYGVRFLKKNITATEMYFFPKNKTDAFNSTEITLVSGEMEGICFRRKGFSVLLGITNEKINVGNMAVIDIASFSDQEKEEAKKKEFAIREKLYMKNTGIFFLECLGNTVFIPVIKIEVDCWKEHWGRFEETTDIHIETNILVRNISPEIEGAVEIKQVIGEMVAQKKVVVDNKLGYPKLAFEEYSKHGEQSEAEEQPSTEYQILEEFKEYCKYEEQRESEKSSEQPSIGSQASDEMLKEFHNLLQKSSDMDKHEGRDHSHDEKVLGIVMNVFSEDRS